MKAFYLDRKVIPTAIAISGAVLVSIACGTGETAVGEDLFQQIVDSTHQYGESDLAAAGIKFGKNYDVEGLTGARAAMNGFWQIGDISVEYEARFYDSHEDAVSLGTKFALEASGETAILVSKEASWSEGVRDRRVMFDFRGAPSAKYGTYVIRSNMILLCEGKDENQARERCGALLDVIEVQ